MVFQKKKPFKSDVFVEKNGLIDVQEIREQLTGISDQIVHYFP